MSETERLANEAITSPPPGTEYAPRLSRGCHPSHNGAPQPGSPDEAATEDSSVELQASGNDSHFIPPSRDWDPGTKRDLPFALLSAALANVPAEPLWAWDGYLAPGAITLLAGRPKVGKSTLLCALVQALAHGREFLDRNTRELGVLLLTEERQWEHRLGGLPDDRGRLRHDL